MLRFALYLLIVLLTITPTHAQDDIILYSLSYSPDGRYVAGVGNRVVIWDGATGSLLADITLPFQTTDSIFMDAAWSPDSTRLALAGDDSRIRILDLSGDAQSMGEILAEFEVEMFMGIRSIAWSPDGSLIAIGGDGTHPAMEFWDGSTYTFVRLISYIFAYRIAWHPDPQRNLLAVTDGYFDGAPLVNTAADAPFNSTHLCVDCAPDAIALPLAWNSYGTLLAIGHTQMA